MPFFDYAAGVSAAAALAVRLVVGHAALDRNPLLSDLTLDSAYYVTWAREIAQGDWASAHGIVTDPFHGTPSPFILNPLYAYVIAPIVGIAADPLRPWRGRRERPWRSRRRSPSSTRTSRSRGSPRS